MSATDIEPQDIKRLDKNVVDKIAAGEIIQRPSSCLKELIENSIDAKSSQINIVVKYGGLKFLQISDNGTGIRKENLEICCERFTTSKLSNYEDLQSMSTYGFRGEALASISHVARLTIQTKTRNAQCAYRAQYDDGKMKGDPVAVAGNQGTQITVEDLFYNVPIRQSTLNIPSEEFQRIHDVVERYAVHNSNIAFSLKKHGEANSIKTSPNTSPVDNIRILFGNPVASNLMKISCADDELKFTMNGYVTNVSYSGKKSKILLFINNRSVECPAIKKSIDELYAIFLPKGQHGFVYISLEVDPKNVDCNVHPTKAEVHFLYEERITEKIKNAIEEQLLGSNDAKKMYTQSLLPGASQVTALDESRSSIGEQIAPKFVVRTDFKEQKIDKFFASQSSEDNRVPAVLVHRTASKSINQQMSEEDSELEFQEGSQRSETNLSSILYLRREVEDSCKSDLKEIVMQLNFVGAVNTTQCLAQSNTKLLLCNTQKLSEEMFYQLLLFEFGNYNRTEFEHPMPIKKLALLGLKSREFENLHLNVDPETKSQQIADILLQNSEMLAEYFHIEINDDGEIESLPMLIEDFSPEISKLPSYIVNLAINVDWTDEQEFFRGFFRETAKFYSKISLLTDKKEWEWMLEHVVFPAVRKSLLPPKSFDEESVILQLTSLPELYKVFERC